MSWCWPPRPVALNELELRLLLESLWLSELPDKPDALLDEPLDNPLDDELCFELELPELPDEV